MTPGQKQAFDHFTSAGYSPKQAAGLVGMLQGESGKSLDPTSLGDGKKARGIAQMHPGRWGYQKSWALSQGLNPDDPDPTKARAAQLAMVTHELEFGTPNEINPQKARIQGIQESDAVAAAGVKHYEKPKDTVGEQRQRGIYANDIQADYQKTPSPAAYNAINAAVDSAGPRAHPPTPGERMRELLGLPAKLTVETTEALKQGVVSLGALAAEVAAQSAAQQPGNPRAAAPPSSFPGRPAGPVSSNTFNPQGSALPGAVSSSALAPADGRTASQRMHAGLAAAGVTASFDRASGRVAFSPTGALGPQGAADYANAGGRNSTPAGMRGFPQGAPTTYGPVDAASRAMRPQAESGGLGGLLGTLGRSAIAGASAAPASRSLTSMGGYSPPAPGPMRQSANDAKSTNASWASARDWGKANAAPAPVSRAAPAYGGPMAAADASNRARPLSSLGLPTGMKTDYTGMDIGTQLTDPTTAYTHVSPQAAMDEANLNEAVAQALSTGYSPGAVSNKKPGEPGYTAPAPQLTPKVAAPAAAKPAARPAAAKPVARPLAPPQSQFAPNTAVYDDTGKIVGAIGQAGKVYTPDFAPNTPVYDQSNKQVGTISGKTTQAQPLGFFGSIAQALGLGYGSNPAATSGGASHGGQNTSGFGSVSGVSPGQIGGLSGKSGRTSSLGSGGQRGNDSGQQHG